MSQPQPARPDLADALIAGFAGAIALTLVHEAARRVVPRAPRMDTLGRRGLARLIDGAGVEPPDRDTLQALALVGDVVTNGLVYAAAVGSGRPDSAPTRGLIGGALVGIGGVIGPPVVGLGPGPDKPDTSTRVMAVAWYTLGGWVAGLVQRRRARARVAGGS